MKTDMIMSNFSEIPDEEQLNMNGGTLPLIAAIALAVIEEVISDWDNFKNGLMGRPEEQ